MASFKIERQILRQQFRTIAGVDEVGRGALFGPVVAAAVVLPRAWIQNPVRGWLREVNDSKLVSPQKRRELAGRILAAAEVVGVGSATNREIDLINIYQASLRAMKRAVENLPVPPDYALIDGSKGHQIELGCPKLCVPGGDRKSISIAAASILAKVLRDEMMIRLDGFFAGYHLAENKGYGTRAHYRALEVKGPTPLHRLSFNLEAKRTPHE